MRSDLFAKRKVRAAMAAVGAMIVVFGGLTAMGTLTSVIQVGPSTVSTQLDAMNPSDLRPEQCVTAGVQVAHVSSGGTNIQGANGGDLILAGDGTASIVGGTADDCILGGQATQIDGGGGTNNVCIGLQSAVMTNCAVEVRTT